MRAAVRLVAMDKEQLRLAWQSLFSKALQHDSWGQIVEAQEDYQRMASAIAAKQGQTAMTSKEKDLMHKLVLCLSARVAAMNTVMGGEQISYNDMQALEPVFQTLFTGRESETFPLPPHKLACARPVRPNADGEILCGDAEEVGEDSHASDWQQVRRVMQEVNGTVVAIRIEKIGLKDAQDYIDPFMTILIGDKQAKLVQSHDTPIGGELQPTYVVFNHQVYLKMSLEDMQNMQAALFFEFKHYKPKKKKVSTRCWGFMELSELRPDEEIVLELYQKPTDLRKKSIKLHTEKPLYLHLYASFIRS